MAWAQAEVRKFLGPYLESSYHILPGGKVGLNFVNRRFEFKIALDGSAIIQEFLIIGWRSRTGGYSGPPLPLTNSLYLRFSSTPLYGEPTIKVVGEEDPQEVARFLQPVGPFGSTETVRIEVSHHRDNP